MAPSLMADNTSKFFLVFWIVVFIYLLPSSGTAWLVIDDSFNFPNGFYILENNRFASSSAFAVSVQNDGRIIVAGNVENGENSDILLMQLNPDGRLDTTFGNSGVVVYDGGQHDLAYAISLQTDSKIIIAGSSHSGQSSDVAVLRYLSTGVLDQQFGQDGVARFDIGGSSVDHGLDVLAEINGRILVTGWTEKNHDKDLFVLALTSAGQLDTSFGTRGVLHYDQGGDELGMTIAKHLDDQVLVAGYTSEKKGFVPLFLAISKGGSVILPLEKDDDNLGIAKGGRIFDIGVDNQGNILLVGTVAVSNSESALFISCEKDKAGTYSLMNLLQESKEQVSGVALSSVVPIKDNSFIVTGMIERNNRMQLFVRKVQPLTIKQSIAIDGSDLIDSSLFTEMENIGTGVAVQTDGKVLVCGWGKDKAGQVKLFVVRLTM